MTKQEQQKNKLKQFVSDNKLRILFLLLPLIWLFTVFDAGRFVQSQRPFISIPFVLIAIFLYFLVKALSEIMPFKSRRANVVVAIGASLIMGYVSSLVLSQIVGNGFSPQKTSPLYWTNRLNDQHQKDIVGLLRPELTWYDKLLIVGVVNVSDGGNLAWNVERNADGSPNLAGIENEDLRKRLERAGYCEIDGKMGAWEYSVPTRSWFGLYYKNFLVTCNVVEFSANIGFGRNFPR